jgi:hypothetical protein
MTTFHSATLRVAVDRIKSLFWGAGLASVLAITSCGGGSTPTPGPPTPVTTVAVTPATATLHRGEKQQFVAKVSGSSDQTVTWQATSGFGTIDGTGLYTAPTDFDGGSTLTVSAKSNAVPAASGTATVTLPSVSFSIAPAAIALALGASHTFSATLIGLSNTQVTWTVPESGGGTISSAGLYTAPSTSGVHTVMATQADNENYVATAIAVSMTNPTSFSLTGTTTAERTYHTAALLNDGRVLVAGNASFDYNTFYLIGEHSAELYDPLSGTFARTGNMIASRYAQTSTLLPSGEVLITGGISDDVFDYTQAGIPALASAELFDASTGSFTSTGSMAEVRSGHTATLLNNNKVLITGGASAGAGPPYFADGSNTAEIYDPLTKVFTTTGSMVTARVQQTATLLADGKVLIAGGAPSSNPTAAAELYDPGTGASTPTGSMKSARFGHTATLLQDGRVLITGGFSDENPAISNTAEIYDPATHSFVATGSMALGRSFHTATLLPDGTVLVVDGQSLVAELYDPLTGMFTLTAVTQSTRTGHSATLLQDGRVLVVGGVFGPAAAESYP